MLMRARMREGLSGKRQVARHCWLLCPAWEDNWMQIRRMSRQSFNQARTLVFRPSVHLLCAAVLLSGAPARAGGLQVTSSGPQTVQKAEGESATLGCSYTPGPLDTGELDVEWSIVSPDTTQKDRMLLFYAGGNTYFHADGALTRGLSFAAGDPSAGDASLAIAGLSPAHSATYQCKVKKSPGVDTRKLSLVVLVRPSAPRCWVEGGMLVGGPVSLRCESASGSAPLKYRWRRESAEPIPAAATQDDATGELRIGNHSRSFAGIYLCEATNAVGAQRCRIALKAERPPNRVAVIAGTVVGSLLFIFILLVFLALLYWKLSTRRRYEKEFSNDIREDAPPPDSRPASRHASRSANRHPRVIYSPADRTEASSSSGGRARSPAGGSRGHATAESPAVSYDSKYGYAV